MLKDKLNLDVFSSISKDQRYFLRNGLIALILWLIVGHYAPIHNFLVQNLAEASSAVIGWISHEYPDTYESEMFEKTNGYKLWNLSDHRGRICVGSPCDGWDLFYLCAAFIFVFPGFSLKRKIAYAFSGIVILYITNVLRVVGLFHILRVYPDWFETFHKTIFQVIVYLIMFAVWLLFLRGKKSEKK